MQSLLNRPCACCRAANSALPSGISTKQAAPFSTCALRLDAHRGCLCLLSRSAAALLLFSRSMQFPSQFGMKGMLLMLLLHVLLMQKSSSMTFVMALDGMLNILKRKGEVIDRELSDWIDFFKQVRTSACIVTQCGTDRWPALFRSGRHPELAGLRFSSPRCSCAQMLGCRLLKFEMHCEDVTHRVKGVADSAEPLSALHTLVGAALLFFAATVYQRACMLPFSAAIPCGPCPCDRASAAAASLLCPHRAQTSSRKSGRNSRCCLRAPLRSTLLSV